VFKRSPVFRIGGDEFCVILQNRDLIEKDALFLNFDSICETTCIDRDDVNFTLSIAKGFAEFDATKDTQFANVFERADNEMYKNKRNMKTLNN
jgi:GGDEF domain-containing protein